MNTKTSFYKMVWRWHFYAGLFCIPFILLLSVTGAIYLFKPEINAFTERSTYRLDKGSHYAAPNDIIAAAIKKIDNSQFQSYQLPKNINDAIKVTLKAEGKTVYVYVNPYTKEAIKTVYKKHLFIEWVKDLHGELLLGKTGSILVELAASWAIVMILTGLYLWWPSSIRSLAGALYPRIHLGGRIFLKDLHTVIGLWISFFVLFLLVSGLPWTTVWGGAFKQTRSFVADMSSDAHENHQPSWRTNSVDNYNLTPQVLATALKLNFAWPSELSVSDKANSIWKLGSMNQNRLLRDTAWISADSGNVIRIQPFASRGLVDKAIGIGISAHEGHLFGRLNQLIGLLTAMGLITLSITGLLMWRKRQPNNKAASSIGAPRATQRGYGAPILLIILPALFLPTLLLSLITLYLLEKLLFSRITRLRQWLCLG